MDPLTAGINAYSITVTLLTKVWDATPEAQKQTTASDIAKTLHNVSEFIQNVQAQINQAVKPQ